MPHGKCADVKRLKLMLSSSDKVKGEVENSASRVVRIENRECSKSICSADVVLLTPLIQVHRSKSPLFIIARKYKCNNTGYCVPFEPGLGRHSRGDDNSGRCHQRDQTSDCLPHWAKGDQGGRGCKPWIPDWTLHPLQQPRNVQRGLLLYKTGQTRKLSSNLERLES